jgi:hypothetical protein
MKQIILTEPVIYSGPQIPSIGLSYSNIFRVKLPQSVCAAIEECPPLRELFVPVMKWAAVRRELDFDIGRRMRGTTGRHVEFYRAVESWRAKKMQQHKQPTTGVKINHA